MGIYIHAHVKDEDNVYQMAPRSFFKDNPLAFDDSFIRYGSSVARYMREFDISIWQEIYDTGTYMMTSVQVDNFLTYMSEHECPSYMPQFVFDGTKSFFEVCRDNQFTIHMG